MIIVKALSTDDFIQIGAHQLVDEVHLLEAFQ